MILAWLASNWRGVVLVVLIAAIGVWILTLRLQLDMTRHDLVAAQQEVTTLSDRIKLQNAAVEKLKADGETRVKSAQDGLIEARHATQAAKTEADRLRRAAGLKSPPGAPRAANCPPSPADRAAETIRSGL